jgi:hypothetical protein
MAGIATVAGVLHNLRVYAARENVASRAGSTVGGALNGGSHNCTLYEVLLIPKQVGLSPNGHGRADALRGVTKQPFKLDDNPW